MEKTLLLANGSVWTVKYNSAGKVTFKGQPVDFTISDGKVFLVVDGTKSLMKEPHIPVPFNDFVLEGGRRVTGVMSDATSAVVNILRYDKIIMQQDGTSYVLPSNPFGDTVLPDPYEGVTFIGSNYHLRIAHEARRNDIIMRSQFGWTEGRKEIVWPLTERQKKRGSNLYPVPYFLQ